MLVTHGSSQSNACNVMYFSTRSIGSPPPGGEGPAFVSVKMLLPHHLPHPRSQSGCNAGYVITLAGPGQDSVHRCHPLTVRVTDDHLTEIHRSCFIKSHCIHHYRLKARSLPPFHVYAGPVVRVAPSANIATAAVIVTSLIVFVLSLKRSII